LPLRKYVSTGEAGAFSFTYSRMGPKSPAAEVDIKSLHAKIGELVLEKDFLARALGKAGFPGVKR